MTRRDLIALFMLGLLLSGVIASYQTLPGYMDADYYFAGGIQLATGKGFTEPYIWNYLADPQALPVPSHTYWMPLASIVSAIGMWLTSSTSYAAGRFPFILLSACIPALTAILAFNLTSTRRIAWTAGLLAVFSCYYAPFLPAVDNYGLYMLLGTLFFLWLPRTQPWTPLLLGMLAGLMTLSRSDGLLWLGLAGLAVLAKSEYRFFGEFKPWLRQILLAGTATVGGYCLIMGVWHLRAWTLFQSFLTPGGGKLLWLQNYRETFIYPASALTRDSFLQAGWTVAVQNRLEALSANLSTAFFAQGSLFLVPFILAGLWHYRADLRVKFGAFAWMLLLVVMSFVFPFAGMHGSFHHAGAALQPLLWILAAVGMDLLLGALQRRGQFTDQFAPFIFQGMLVVFALGFTVFLVNTRVVANGWAQDDVIYGEVEAMLQDNGISPMDVVIVPNPPGYYVRTRRSAIRLPAGDETSLLAVSEKFQAWYLILEKSRDLGPLQPLYDVPQSRGPFRYLGTTANARLYEIVKRP